MREDITIEDVYISLIALTKYKFLIIMVSIFTFLGGCFVALDINSQDIYSSTTTVYSSNYGSYEQTVTGINVLRNYSDVLKSRKICERAASYLNDVTLSATAIQGMITISTNDSDNIINITAYSRNPETALELSNAVADAFVVEVSEITGSETVKVLDEAKDVYLSKSGMKKIAIFLVLSAFAGFAISCFLLFIKELFSDRLKTLNKCNILMEGNILGVLPRTDKN